MRSIEIDDRTYDKLEFSARLMRRTIGEVVRLLVEQPGGEATTPAGDAPRTPPSTTASTSELEGVVRIHKTFKTHLVEGRFDPSTLEVWIDTAPWSGKGFTSPTAAAQAVVETYSGDRVVPNTNGRKFWKVTSTGRDLRSIIGERI